MALGNTAVIAGNNISRRRDMLVITIPVFCPEITLAAIPRARAGGGGGALASSVASWAPLRQGPHCARGEPV